MIDKRPRSPREVAAWTLFSMREEGAWSDGALHHYLSRAALSGRDAALAARLAYGTVQNQILLDHYLRQFSRVRLAKIAPRVLDLLRMGLYQLILLDKIPAHAAVSETVALVRRYARANERTVAFVNGVLRSVARAVEADALPALDRPDKESYYALRYSHPEWLVRRWSEQFGIRLAGQICAANNADTPLSVRVNTARTTPEAAQRELEAAGLTVTPHRAMPTILLCHGGAVAALPAFTEGRITIQDAASALAAIVADPQPGDTVLDCCAAPGGKSFAMAERMQGKGSVTACDIHAHKLERIAAGAARLGLPIVHAQLQDAAQPCADWMGAADVVLCDVPCSGLGIIRKKPEIRYKEPGTLTGLRALQARILQNCAQYVRPGGTLVYSTCTIIRRENEDVVRAFLAENTAFHPVPWSHPVCGTREDGMATLLPPVHDTDGFFIAKLRRDT
ncbi:MAG: 16S rRNA (cytosine(967)-C(5))-methyltransferase RsmB [Eubacteriales bacterium]|nr:16S rRNA (cytosine(967)-C(5))-methyltransferase RsmB [Eubacteriales bacterium]